jgi:hypothetical protein
MCDVLRRQEGSHLNQLMNQCLLEPLNSNLGRGFGGPGHWASANFLCGWWHMIDVGRQTYLKKGDCLIPNAALYVTRKWRP